MAGDHAHALVELGRDGLRRRALEEGDAALAARAKHFCARLLHLGRVGAARHRDVAERETEIAGPELGEAEAGHVEDRLAIRDAFRALELDAEQQLALRVERPRLAAREVLVLRDAPDRRRGRLRAAAARADAEQRLAAGVAPRRAAGGAAQPRDR